MNSEAPSLLRESLAHLPILIGLSDPWDEQHFTRTGGFGHVQQIVAANAVAVHVVVEPQRAASPLRPR